MINLSGKTIKKLLPSLLAMTLAAACAKADNGEIPASGERDKMKVIVDSDPGLAVRKLADPEDAFALMLLLRSPDVELLGICINFVNVGLELSLKSAQIILEEADRTDIPILTGAASGDDLGQRTEAVDFLIERIDAEPGEIHIISLGAMTNIATAIQIDSLWPSKIAGMTIMAGAIDVAGNVPPAMKAETNVYGDPIAADIVFSAVPGAALIPLDLTNQVKFRQHEMDRLASSDDPVAELLYENIQDWFDINRQFLGEGFYLFYSAATAFLIWTDLFSEIEDFPVGVTVESGADYGRTFQATDTERPTLRVPFSIDADLFHTRLIDTILSD